MNSDGAAMSEDSSLLHYFALPHITEPKLHRSFSGSLFNDSWVPRLHSKLAAFLQRVLKTVPVPKLVRMLMSFQSNHAMLRNRLEDSETKMLQCAFLARSLFVESIGLAQDVARTLPVSEGGAGELVKVIYEQLLF